MTFNMLSNVMSGCGFVDNRNICKNHKSSSSSMRPPNPAPPSNGFTAAGTLCALVVGCASVEAALACGATVDAGGNDGAVTACTGLPPAPGLTARFTLLSMIRMQMVMFSFHGRSNGSRK